MADRTSSVRIDVDANTTGASSKLKGFVGIAGKAALGVAGLAVGTAIGANKLYAFADAADDANASIEHGIDTMGIFGKKSAEVAGRVEDFAKKTSLATAVDINSIKATQAKLLTFKELAKTADKAGGSFDRATLAAVDMAAKGFGAADTNAVQLGKALNDPIKGIAALTKSGITFTEAEKTKIATMVESGRITQAQGFILTAIEKQVGGTAAATAGGFELMKNRVSIFAQELAGRALPYMDRFGNFMINKGAPAMAEFGRTVQEKAGPPLRQFVGFVQDKVIPVVIDLAGWVRDHLVPAYGKVLAGALEGARGFVKNVTDAFSDNKKEIGDLVDAAKKLANFFVDKVLPVLGDLYKNVLPKIGDVIALQIDTIATLVDAFQKVYDKVQDVIGAISDFKNKMENLPGAGALGAIAGAVTRTTGGGTLDLLHNPRVPRTDAASSATPSRVDVHLHFDRSFNGFVGDEVTLARALGEILSGNRRFGPQAA